MPEHRVGMQTRNEDKQCMSELIKNITGEYSWLMTFVVAFITVLFTPNQLSDLTDRP